MARPAKPDVAPLVRDVAPSTTSTKTHVKKTSARSPLITETPPCKSLAPVPESDSVPDVSSHSTHAPMMAPIV